MADLSKVTSSCYCGKVLLEYSVEGDNFITSVRAQTSAAVTMSDLQQFICHCTDDRKITSSVFASNFVIVSAVDCPVAHQDHKISDLNTHAER